MIEIRHTRNEQLDKAYDTLYDETPIRHLDSLYAWILKVSEMRPGQRYLDVACGQARVVELALEQGIKAFGTDYSFSALSASKNTSRLFLANGEALPFASRSVERVTNIGSLEHYVDPLRGASEMARILTDEGIACILLPNTFSLTATVLHAYHTGSILDDGQPLQRYCTREGWQKILEAGGFEVLRVRKYERPWPSSLRDLAFYLARPKELIHLLISPFIPTNLSFAFVFICRKKRGA